MRNAGSEDQDNGADLKAQGNDLKSNDNISESKTDESQQKKQEEQQKKLEEFRINLMIHGLKACDSPRLTRNPVPAPEKSLEKDNSLQGRYENGVKSACGLSSPSDREEAAKRIATIISNGKLSVNDCQKYIKSYVGGPPTLEGNHIYELDWGFYRNREKLANLFIAALNKVLPNENEKIEEIELTPAPDLNNNNHNDAQKLRSFNELSLLAAPPQSKKRSNERDKLLQTEEESSCCCTIS